MTNIVLLPTYTSDGQRVIGAGEFAEMDCDCGTHTHAVVFEGFCTGRLLVECDGCGGTYDADLADSTTALPLAA